MSEGRILSRYLLGVSGDAGALQLYERAAKQLRDESGGRDERLLAFVCKFPSAIGPIDGALALLRPDALLRRKLHVMSAILETRPLFADHFLAVDRPPAYAVCVLYFGLRALAKAAVGMVLLRLLR